MPNEFTEGDIGRLVSLTIDLSLLNGEIENGRIPYDAIKEREFLLRVASPSTTKRIKDVGPVMPRVSSKVIADGLGAGSMKGKYVVVGVGDEYLEVENYPER
ncbi:MAG: hypothetical protein CMH62_02390 [Nanoarchaeota archaeon]|nr:hypothetical protein [Nanoarchaeota archaeon]|tara:strand:+ start:229 stop:534 length:306 start_codon:yes stop_codon:yes gene_type:complete